MDERRLDIIKAAAKFSGVEIKDKDQLSEFVQHMVTKSERYTSVFCIPGAIACMSYASFLAHFFGAQEDQALMDGFFAENDKGFWKARRYIPRDLMAKKSKGMTYLELMAMEVAASLVNADGDKDVAFESMIYDISEKISYANVVEQVAQVTCTILEHVIAEKGIAVVNDMQRKFNKAYREFAKDVRDHPDMDEILPTIISALSEKDPTLSIPLMTISVVMSSVSTSVPLEVYEKFWKDLRGETVVIGMNLGDVLSGYTEKAQDFIEDIGKKLED